MCECGEEAARIFNGAPHFSVDNLDRTKCIAPGMPEHGVAGYDIGLGASVSNRRQRRELMAASGFREYTPEEAEPHVKAYIESREREADRTGKRPDAPEVFHGAGSTQKLTV